MVDLDEIARRAVASPPTRPPTMARIEEVARRRRRRLRSVRTLSAAVVLVALTALIMGMSGGSSGQVRVAIGSSSERTSSSSTPREVPPSFDRSALVDALRGEGRTVTAMSGQPSSSLFDVPVHLMCVDDFAIRVYEYSSEGARAGWSGGISADGSRVASPDGNYSIPEWIAPPHFFARGRLIVLHLGSSAALDVSLTRILGSTLSPDARVGTPAVDERCDGSLR